VALWLVRLAALRFGDEILKRDVRDVASETVSPPHRSDSKDHSLPYMIDDMYGQWKSCANFQIGILES
jgi:hypothetical protein